MKNIELLLKEALDRLGLDIKSKQIGKFDVYLMLLKEWNKKFNLTAITDDDEIIIKHFADSLACLLGIPESLCFKGCTLMDVGSGAGFPGIPLKLYNPNFKLALLEASRKKANFLKNVCCDLNLEAVEILTGRAEEYGRDPGHREKYDLVVGRAVAKLSVLVEYALPFLKREGVFVAQKGPEVTDELKEANPAIDLLGGVIKHIKPYELELKGGKFNRNLVVLEKVKFTPGRYPRRAGIPKKKPIK